MGLAICLALSPPMTVPYRRRPPRRRHVDACPFVSREAASGSDLN